MNKDCFNIIYIIFICMGFIKNVIPIMHYVQNKIIARVLIQWCFVCVFERFKVKKIELILCLIILNCTITFKKIKKMDFNGENVS